MVCSVWGCALVGQHSTKHSIRLRALLDVRHSGDIAVDSITDYQMDDLSGLKERLYRKRTQARLDTEPAERRQRREEAKKGAGVQAVFDF